ncbi:MAG: phosphotriesterase-related protein [Chloroflexi bacterium]|nr:phosphotriesterase-related protein [Chloroflexota bacterium]
MASPTVMTVLGPIPADALGPTLVHEHVFFDTMAYFKQADDDPDGTMAAAPVAAELRWWVNTHPQNSRDNLVQDSLEVAVSELAQLSAAGGRALVDVTPIGVAPNPKGLAAAARRTGLQIVAGTGYYIALSLPESVVERSVDELAESMRRDLLEGIAGTDIRAGLIGELGLSNPPAPVELRVLEAAARVQRELDCAVSIHPGWGADGARTAMQLAEDVGMNPGRTALCHLDNRLRDDLAAYREVAARGFRLEMDRLGSDTYYPHVNTQLLSDGDRIRTILGLLDAGLTDQLLFSQDICYKHDLVRFGGTGYAHILRTIRPRLLRSGGDEATIRRILVDNPRTFLAGV